MDPDSSPDLPPLKRGTYDIEAILAAAENAEFAIPPPPRSRIGNSFEPSSSFSTAFDTTITPATVAAASRNKKQSSSNNSTATTPTSTTSKLGARRGTVTRVSPSSASATTPPSAADHSRHHTPHSAGAGMDDEIGNHPAGDENGHQAPSRFHSRRSTGSTVNNTSIASAAARLSNRSSPMLRGISGGSPAGPNSHLDETTPLSRALSPLNPRSRRGSIGGGGGGGGGTGGRGGGTTDTSFVFSSPSSSRPGSRPESRGSYALRSRDLSSDSLMSFNVMLEQEGLDDEEDHHQSMSAVANGSSSGRLPFFLSDPEHIKLLEGEIEDPFSPNSSTLMDDHDPMMLREQLAAAAGGPGSLMSPLGSRRGLSNDSDNSRGSERPYTDANGFLSPEHGPVRHRDHSNSHNTSLYNTSYESSPHSINEGEHGNGSGGIGNGSFSGSSHQGDSSAVLSASERRKLARLERRKKLLESIKTSADPLETVSSLAVASPTSPPDSANDKFGSSDVGSSSGLGHDNHFNDHYPHHDQPWYAQHEHHQDEYGLRHDGSFQHSFDQSPHHSMDHHHGYSYEGMEDLHHSGFHLADSSPYHGPEDEHSIDEPRATSFAEWMSNSADISRLDLKSPVSRSASPLAGGTGLIGRGVPGKDGMASLNAIAAAANAATSSSLTTDIAGQGIRDGRAGEGGMLPTSTSGVGNILLSPAFSSESAPITGSSPVFQSLQSDSSLYPSSTPMAPSVLTSSFSPAHSPEVNTNIGHPSLQPLPTAVPLDSAGSGSNGLFHQSPSSATASTGISTAALGIGSGIGNVMASIRAMGLSEKMSPTAKENSSTPSMAPASAPGSGERKAEGGERSKEMSPNEDTSVLNTVEVAFETEEKIAVNADQRPSGSESTRAPTPLAPSAITSENNTEGEKKTSTTTASFSESALPPSSSGSNGGTDHLPAEGSLQEIHPLDPNNSQLQEGGALSAAAEKDDGLNKKEDPSTIANGGSPTLVSTTENPTNKPVASTKSSEAGSGGGGVIRRPSGLLVSARIRDSTNLDAPRYSIREMEEMKKNVRMDLRIEITNEIREEFEKTAEQEAALFQFEIQQLKTALEKEEHEKAQLKAVLDEFEASLEDIALNTTKELSTIKEENARLTEEKEEVEKSFVMLKTRYDELISHNEKHVENERVLRSAIEALKLDYENAEARYEKVKSHAETKLSEAQVELEAMRMMYEQELALMRTTMMQQQQQMAQQHQIEKRELEMKLEAKTRENEELIQFSEELIAKLG
ncbi:hypothetical protein BGW42_001384 [Actinomortierella wolfii]|nr:hypothetical protein BGW42_001384 [Actinomortierella wolfii]